MNALNRIFDLLCPPSHSRLQKIPRCHSASRFAGLAVLLFVWLAVTPSLAEDANRITFRPEITREALINPGMGFVNFHYSNRLWAYGSQKDGERVPADTLEWFPGCSTIYFRLPWCVLEPEEGVFRWDLIDSWAQPWIQAGKKIAFRITCSENRWAYATPRWVRDAGAKGVEYVWPLSDPAIPGGETLWEPDYRDPIFLEKLDHFLAAMAKRYGGKEYVAFIDVGTFGMWGEGHTGRSSKLSQETTDEIVRIHVDLHKKHFPDSQLVISDDVAGSSRPGKHFPSLDYAFSQGVTLRDDSIMVNTPPHSWYHSELASVFWPTLPVVVEHEHFGLSSGRGAWSPELLEKAVEEYHASYLSIHWFPAEYLEKNREAIERINLRLGYRLELRQASFPKCVTMDAPFTVETVWANVGTAPCYSGGIPTFTLMDSENRIVWVRTDETLNVRDLPVAEPGKAVEVPHSSTLQAGFVAEIPEINDGVIVNLKKADAWPYAENVPMLKPGSYSLYVSIGDPDGTPEIALPLTHDDGHRRYFLGEMEVLPQK